MRRLLAGDDSGFVGTRFSLPAGAQLRYELERAEVPLLVGTWSPRLGAFAGTAATELKAGGSANPALVPVMRERIGNDGVGIVLGAVTVVDEDGDRARAAARREVAMYVDVVGATTIPTRRPSPSCSERDPRARRTPDGTTTRARCSPTTCSARFAFAGTPAEVAAQAEEVLDAGALRVDFGTPHGIDRDARHRAPLPRGAAAA